MLIELGHVLVETKNQAPVAFEDNTQKTLPN